jgi:hypothetical protein
LTCTCEIVSAAVGIIDHFNHGWREAGSFSWNITACLLILSDVIRCTVLSVAGIQCQIAVAIGKMMGSEGREQTSTPAGRSWREADEYPCQDTARDDFTAGLAPSSPILLVQHSTNASHLDAACVEQTSLVDPEMLDTVSGPAKHACCTAWRGRYPRALASIPRDRLLYWSRCLMFWRIRGVPRLLYLC